MPFPHNVPTDSNNLSSHMNAMSPAEKTPLLHLSEIMHEMSPSPVPVEEERERSGSATPRGTSPEPVSETEALGIRRRLEEMGLWKSTANNLSSREKELVDMITRLVDPLPIDPGQLGRQAETIAALIIQRDYVLQQAAEDRERWKYERETWDRTAEALLAQKSRSPKIEETNTRERQIYDMEMRSLENKLAEAQRRQSALESELQKLKPLLFIQPYFIPRQDKGKAREISNSNNPEPVADPSTVASSSKLPYTYHSSSHHRRRTHRSSKRYNNPKGTPLSADAYSEHLLLAMRKVGRTRAAQVSGIIEYAERANDKITKEQQYLHTKREHQRAEKGRLAYGASGGASATTAYYRRSMGDFDTGPSDGPPRPPPSIPPRTPVKSTVIHYGPSTTADNAVNMPIVFVHTNTPTPTPHRHPPGSPQYTPVASSSLATHHQQQSGPPTPLDSLIDAARMMDNGAKRNNGKARARERDDEPESPVPSASSKRRKLSASASLNLAVPPGKAGSSKLDRPRSALDVLADQAAAAFNEPEQSDRRASIAAAANANIVNAGNRNRSTSRRRGEEDGDEAQPQRRGRGRPRGSFTSAKSIARAREASASGSASTSTTSTTPAVTTSASGRPIRQTRRAEQAQSQSTSTAGAAPRGTGRPRGRPRGSTNASRSSGSQASASISRMIAPSMRAPRDEAPSRAQDAQGDILDERSRIGSTGVGSEASSSIASEVLRHGFADATRLRLSATSSIVPERAKSPLHVQPPQPPSVYKPRDAPRPPFEDEEDVEIRHVPTHADAVIVVSPDPSQSPPSPAADYPILKTTMRPVQSWGGPPRSPVLSEPEGPRSPPPPPPQASHVPSYPPDPQHVAAVHSTIDVHETPQAHASPSRSTGGGEPDPDAEAMQLDTMGSGEPARVGDDADSMASRADKMDADRALDAEAEARHNLPQGTSHPQSPSDPPLPHAALLGGTVDGGWDNGDGDGANDIQSHDGDVDGEHDADAEGEMEVEEETQVATAAFSGAVDDESASSAAGGSSGKLNHARSGPIPPVVASK